MFRCRKTLSTEKHNLTFSVNYEVIGKGISDLEVCKHRIHKNLRVLWFQVCHLPSLMLFPLTYSRPFIKHLHRSEFNGEENLENESNTNYTLHCCGYHSKSSFPTLPSATATYLSLPSGLSSHPTSSRWPSSSAALRKPSFGRGHSCLKLWLFQSWGQWFVPPVLRSQS